MIEAAIQAEIERRGGDWLLKGPEAAQVLGCSIATLRRLADDPDTLIEEVRFGGSAKTHFMRYSYLSLQEFIASNRVRKNRRK